MSDLRQRELQRAASQGDPIAAGRLLLEDVRAGRLPRRRLEVLAEAGWAPARVAMGAPVREPLAVEDADLQALQRTVAEAIVWCAERLAAPTRGGVWSRLRTAELSPGRSTWTGRGLSHEERIDTVGALAARRRALLEREGWAPGARAESLAGGRLLLYDPEMSLGDGAAADASHGFFTRDDVPAWDTWVACAEDPCPLLDSFWSCLVCWVPGALVDRVEAGLRVGPAGCVEWLDEVEGPFTERLRDMGLV